MAQFSSGILDVHATSMYPSTPQVSITWTPRFTTITSEGGSATSIAFSFDGVNDHGVLTVGGNYTTFPMSRPGKPQPVKVWLRAVTSVGTEKAQVMAWT